MAANKYLLIVIAVLAGVLITIVGLDHWKPAATSNLHWMSDLAKSVDPKFAGQQSGFLMLSMSCVSQVPGVQGVTYAYAKFDVDLKSGQFKPIAFAPPPVGFKCPEQAAVPARPPAPQVAPTPTPQVPAKKK